MFVTIGVLLQFMVGTFLSWRQAAFANCLVPILCLILLFFIPESPTWLLYMNRNAEAQQNLAWLRGWSHVNDIREEFAEMSVKVMESVQRNERQRKTVFEIVQLLGRRELYYPFILIIFSFILDHFNGTTSLITYAIPIFRALKAPINEYYITVVMGSMQLLGCIIATTVIKHLGKRVTNFISLLGSSLCLVFVASYIYINKFFYFEDPFSEDHSKHWAPATLLVISTFWSFLGVKILPWLLIGEIFPNEYRAKATGFASAFGYLLGFISIKMFLSMVSLMTLPGVFFLFGFVGFLGIGVLYCFMPETEGKTLFEICDHFSGVSKLGNEVGRHKRIGNTNVEGYLTIKMEESLSTRELSDSAHNDLEIFSNKKQVGVCE